MERCHSDGTKYISGGELQLRTLRSLRSSTVVTSVLLQHSVLSSVMSLERGLGGGSVCLVNVLRRRTHVGVQYSTRMERRSSVSSYRRRNGQVWRL